MLGFSWQLVCLDENKGKGNEFYFIHRGGEVSTEKALYTYLFLYQV
jgi:hypothetical protein